MRNASISVVAVALWRGATLYDFQRAADGMTGGTPTMIPTDTIPAPPGGGGGTGSRRDLLSRVREAAWVALPALATVAALALAEFERAAPSGTAAVQLVCVFVALSWVFAALKGTRQRGGSGWRLRLRRWLPGLALLAVAFALRYWMLAYLPLPGRTGFEELQMGADGYKVLLTHALALEFRFSKVIAAIGLGLGGETVEALRLPFQLMGYARLAVLVLCLRALKAGWWPTAFVTLAAAVSRWFVIGSGVAYEDFSPILFMLLAVWCLIEVDVTRPAATAWAAGAGIFAGVLMFENSSFRFVILLAGGWLLWLALGRAGTSGVPRPARMRPFAFFGVTFVLVSAPMLVNVLHAGVRSIFFEAFVRYAQGRSGLLAPTFLANLEESVATLAGWPVRISFYLAPEYSHAVHPLIGTLLVAACLAGLVRPRVPFVGAMMVAVLLAIVICCAATNYFVATRIAPVFSLLLLAVGTLLDDLERWVTRILSPLSGVARDGDYPRESGPRVARTRVLPFGAAVVYGVLSLWVVAASAARIRAMARDRDVRNEYLNDQYVTASFLARVARPGSRVLVVTPGKRRDWSPLGIAHWVYARKRLRVEGMPQLPDGDGIAPGTLVVIGAEGRALTEGEIAELAALAARKGSAQTLDVYRGRGARPLVASICVGCGAGVLPDSGS